MPLCCLCSNAIQEILHAKVPIDERSRTLVKELLKMAGLKFENCAGKNEILCEKCEKDLENVEIILLRIGEGHRKRLLDVPTIVTPTDHSEQSYNAASQPIQIISLTNSTSKNCHPEIENELLPRKRRVRRLPKRYRDEETADAKPVKNIKISTYPIKLHSSMFSSYPKMAYLRTRHNIVIGDLVEVPHRGRHSRLRILCWECNEVFAQERLFRQHMRKHIKEKEKKTLYYGNTDDETINFLYFCTLCDKAFQEHSTVRRHFKASHNEHKPFQCEMCPAAFKYKTNLDYHKAKHLSQRNHQCPRCEKKFVLRYELQLHLRIHSGEKPFRCQICSIAFAHRSNLQKHREVHIKHANKMINCHKCRSSFKSRMSFKRHYERIHTICNSQAADSNISQQHTIMETQNLSNICDISKSMDNNSISLRGIESIRDFQEFPKATSSKINLNFVPQTSDASISIGGEELAANLMSLNADNFHTTFDSKGAYTHLAETVAKFEKPTITAGDQFIQKPRNSEHGHDISSFNTASLDFVQSTHNSNINSTDQTTYIKPLNTGFINILPKNLKIIKIPKTQSLKLQEIYRKSSCRDDGTNLFTVRNNKNVTNGPDDCTQMSLTYSSNKLQSLQVDKQKILTDSRMNDTTYLPERNFIKIPVTSNDSCSTLQQNIAVDKNFTNLEMVPLDDDFKSSKILGTDNVLTAYKKRICPDSILKISNCNKINENHVSKNFKLTADCNKEPVKWNHFQNSPQKSSILKSHINAENKIIYNIQCKKLEKCGERITNVKEDNAIQIWDKYVEEIQENAMGSNVQISSNIEEIQENAKGSNVQTSSNIEEIQENTMCNENNTSNVEQIHRNTMYNENMNSNKKELPKNTMYNENTSLTNNITLAKDFLDSYYPKSLSIMPATSNTTTATNPLNFKISPYSLLKSQTPQLWPTHSMEKGQTTSTSKPVITNVEILPQLDLKEIQRSSLSNERSLQPPSSTSYVMKIPPEYKFQCSICWKYFQQKSALTKHLRTHSGEKPYKCNVCPKSYADASNYKKHKMLHTKAAEALNIARPKAPASPALSNVTDPDPDGIEVMQTIQPFQISSGDSDDDEDDVMESYLWQDAFQHSLINTEMRENIRRNLKVIMPPSTESGDNIGGRRRSHIFSP